MIQHVLFKDPIPFITSSDITSNPPAAAIISNIPKSTKSCFFSSYKFPVFA
jgi:hypothetical protein